MNMKVVHTEKRLCPCCMEEHDIKKVNVNESVVFKDITVDYTAEYYYCDIAEELYMDEQMINDNDIRMKDSYRQNEQLLTSREIYAIRLKYGISQSDLATILGWGKKTITRYESHYIQDKAHDTILRKISQDPEWYICLLDESKSIFTKEAYERYMHIATALYNHSHDYYLRKVINAIYAEFFGNKKYNGNASLSLDKVVDVICYFSNSVYVNDLNKTKLMKLLWYSDFLAYKKRGYAVTGLVYQAQQVGAVPIGHEYIIELNGICCEEIDDGNGTVYLFNKSKNDKYINLSQSDRSILNIIINKFGNMTKDEMILFVNNETVYKETEVKDIISYEYANNLLI